MLEFINTMMEEWFVDKPLLTITYVIVFVAVKYFLKRRTEKISYRFIKKERLIEMYKFTRGARYYTMILVPISFFITHRMVYNSVIESTPGNFSENLLFILVSTPLILFTVFAEFKKIDKKFKPIERVFIVIPGIVLVLMFVIAVSFIWVEKIEIFLLIVTLSLIIPSLLTLFIYQFFEEKENVNIEITTETDIYIVRARDYLKSNNSIYIRQRNKKTDDIECVIELKCDDVKKIVRYGETKPKIQSGKP